MTIRDYSITQVWLNLSEIAFIFKVSLRFFTSVSAGYRIAEALLKWGAGSLVAGAADVNPAVSACLSCRGKWRFKPGMWNRKVQDHLSDFRQVLQVRFPQNHFPVLRVHLWGCTTWCTSTWVWTPAADQILTAQTPKIAVLGNLSLGCFHFHATKMWKIINLPLWLEILGK